MCSQSSGRDRVLILWDIASGKSIRVLPVYEGIEGAFMMPANNLPAFVHVHKRDGIYIASAGEKGMCVCEYNLLATSTINH